MHEPCPGNKVHGAYMGPTWGRQDPGGPHVGPMNLATRVSTSLGLSWKCHSVTIYSAVPLQRGQFSTNHHKIRPIARPLGRGMRCFLCIQTLIYILPQYLQWCMKYPVIFDRVITATKCIYYHVTKVLCYPTNIHGIRLLCRESEGYF